MVKSVIRLEFNGSSPLRSANLWPATSFRVAGNFIRDAETGRILARFHNHFWDVNGQHYTGYRCPDRLTVRFENVEGGSSETNGPFDGIFVADGSVYANETLIAKFIDQTLLWHEHATDTFWPNMIL